MTTITLRSPETAIASLPYLLGFTPERSLITITTVDVDGRQAVGLTTRVDLPAPGEDLEAFAAEYRSSVISAMGRVPNASSVAVIVVDDTPAGPDQMAHVDLVDQVTRDLAPVGDVLDVLYTDGDTYRSYLCTDPGCPCLAGAEISSEIKDSVAAEFVARGVAPAGSRSDLQRSWDAPGDAARMEQVATWCAQASGEPLVDGYDSASPIDRAAAQLSVAQDAIDVLSSPAVIPPDVERRLVQVLTLANTDIRVRDALAWTASRTPSPVQPVIADQLTRLGSTMPIEHREAVATIAGLSRYLAGDGAQASIAVRQALAANPDARLASMLDTALAAGLPPQEYASTMQSLSAEQAVGLTPLAQASPDPVHAATTPAAAPAV